MLTIPEEETLEVKKIEQPDFITINRFEVKQPYVVTDGYGVEHTLYRPLQTSTVELDNEDATLAEQQTTIQKRRDEIIKIKEEIIKLK